MPCPWTGFAGAGRGIITQGVVCLKKWTVVIRGVGSPAVEEKELAAKAETYLEPEMLQVVRNFQKRYGLGQRT